MPTMAGAFSSVITSYSIHYTKLYDYLIGHQRQESYTALRDVLTEGAKSFGRKLLHPFRSASQAALGPDAEEFWALRDLSFVV